jgi:hypothetical protein
MVNTIAWLPLSDFTGGGASIAIALDPTGASLIGSSAVQAVVITSSTMAPAGVSGWVSPVSSVPVSPDYTGGLQLGNIQPGYCYPIWIRRTANNTVAINGDAFGVQFTFSSAG